MKAETVVCVFLCVFPVVFCNDLRDMITSLDGKLSTYDKRIRPGFGGPPVKISVSMYITTAYDFDDSRNVSLLILI